MSENSLVWNFIARDKASGTADKLGEKFGGLGKKIKEGFGVAALGGITALGAGLVNLLKGSTEAASNLGESVNAVQTIFKGQSKVIQNWGETQAESFGLSKRAFNEMATPMGALLKNAGLSLQDTSKWTIDLTKRASDMASVFNTSVPDALEAIQAGLRGEQDPLERYGVSLSAAKVQAQALAETHKKSAKDLTSTELATARLNIIMKQTSDTQGDFQKTSNQLANSQRIEQARLENLQASIGQKMLPLQLAWTKAKLAFAGIVEQKVLPLLNKLADWAGSVIPVAYGKATSVIKSLSGVWNTIVTVGKAVIGFYMKHSELINTLIVSMYAAYKVLQVVRFAIIAWTVAQRLLNLALAANPIGLIVVAIGALVGAFIYAYRNSDTFRKIVNTAFDAVKKAFFAVVDASKPVWQAFVELGKSAGKLWDSLKPVRDWIVANLFPILQKLASYYLQYVMATFKVFATIVRTVIWPAVKFIISLFADIIAAGIRVITGIVNMVTGIVNTIRGAYGKVKSVVDGIIKVVKDPWGSAQKWLIQPAIDMIGGLGSGMLQKARDIGNWVKDIGGKIVNGIKNFFGIHSPSTVTFGLGVNLLQGLLNGLASTNPLDIAKNVFGSLPSALSSMLNSGIIKAQQLSKKAMDALGSAWNAGANDIKVPGGLPADVMRWVGVAAQALQLAGAPQSWLYSLMWRMHRESGGNPFAINLWDSNAKAGDPSRGLMQTIGSTFNAYAGALRGRGIYDPLANIYAAIKYTIARYGSGPAGWNRPGGYDDGGWLLKGWTATYNGTNDKEAIFTKKQLDEFRNGNSGGDTYIFQHSGPLIGDDVDDWMVSKLDSLKRRRRIS